jgi:hypothetical protein
MKFSVKSIQFLLGACIAALAITFTTACGAGANHETPSSSDSAPVTQGSQDPYMQPSATPDLPVIVLPEANVTGTVENQAGSKVQGLSCDKKISVPVTLKPDAPITLDDSEVILTIDENMGAFITALDGIPGVAVIVNERLAAPVSTELQTGASRTIQLPNIPIIKGGWQDAVDPDLSFEKIVLCRSLVTS